MDRSSVSASAPDWTEGTGGRSHAVRQPRAVTRERHTAACFTAALIMIALGVPARSPAVNRMSCVAAGGRGTRATPDDAPRPSRRALPPLPRRDVGALLVLRDAWAARALPCPVDASPARPHRLRQSRARLVTRRREPPL